MLLFSPSAVSGSLVTSQWACQAPLSMGLSRQGFWGELQFPLQGIFWPRDWTRVFCIGRQILHHWAPWGAWCYNLCLQLHFRDWLRYLSWRQGLHVCLLLIFKISNAYLSYHSYISNILVRALLDKIYGIRDDFIPTTGLLLFFFFPRSCQFIHIIKQILSLTLEWQELQTLLFKKCVSWKR